MLSTKKVSGRCPVCGYGRLIQLTTGDGIFTIQCNRTKFDDCTFKVDRKENYKERRERFKKEII